MIDAIAGAWNLFLAIVNGAPIGLWTLILAFLGSALLTQRLKFYLDPCLSKRTRAMLSQGIAFWSAFGITYVLWPTHFGLIAGGCMGLASPTIYAISVRIIGKRWPDLRDLLSQDVRES